MWLAWNWLSGNELLRLFSAVMIEQARKENPVQPRKAGIGPIAVGKQGRQRVFLILFVSPETRACYGRIATIATERRFVCR